MSYVTMDSDVVKWYKAFYSLYELPDCAMLFRSRNDTYTFYSLYELRSGLGMTCGRDRIALSILFMSYGGKD